MNREEMGLITLPWLPQRQQTYCITQTENAMKTLIQLVLLVSSTTFILTGCTSSEDDLESTTVGDLTITPLTLGNLEFVQLQGSITSDFTITNDQLWLINGGLFVEEGAVLTIEPGATVYATFNDLTSFISVQRGARIVADGSAAAPIKFTTIRELTSIPQPGDWGGIIINGYAPVNLTNGEGEGEGGTGIYGGDDPTDNSGILRYVIVSYAGKQLGPDNELNGFSFNAVGSGTTVEYIEAIYGLDDGIELFGGSVNIKYALSLGNADDSFDWTFGWSGFGQFWVVQQDPFGSDKAIEADNNEDDFLASPFSQPIVSNLTLVGADDGDSKNSGVNLRHGTKGAIHNAIITNFPRDGVIVDETAEDFVVTNELMVSHSRVFDNNMSGAEGVDFRNAISFESNESNFIYSEPVLDGFTGVIAGEGIDPIQFSSWFTSVDYIGAVDPTEDWTAGWIEILR